MMIMMMMIDDDDEEEEEEAVFCLFLCFVLFCFVCLIVCFRFFLTCLKYYCCSGQPHAVFGVFVSISGGCRWVLLCKKRIMAENNSHTAMQRITSV